MKLLLVSFHFPSQHFQVGGLAMAIADDISMFTFNLIGLRIGPVLSRLIGPHGVCLIFKNSSNVDFRV